MITVFTKSAISEDLILSIFGSLVLDLLLFCSKKQENKKLITMGPLPIESTKGAAIKLS